MSKWKWKCELDYYIIVFVFIQIMDAHVDKYIIELHFHFQVYHVILK